MQGVVGNAITYEQQRLIMIIQTQLSGTDKQHLIYYLIIRRNYLRQILQSID